MPPSKGAIRRRLEPVEKTAMVADGNSTQEHGFPFDMREKLHLQELRSKLVDRADQKSRGNV